MYWGIRTDRHTHAVIEGSRWIEYDSELDSRIIYIL